MEKGFTNYNIIEDLSALKGEFSGDIYTDYQTRILYATDASTYREIPLAVVYPKENDDIRILIEFVLKHNTSIIPRTAGTSIAGQVVGGGIIVDVSRYMTKILEFNEKGNWVKVQPGVVRDELNRFLEPSGLFFSPETSTSDRCMIGGMVGNNACGMHSLIYGSTRDHVISIKGYLPDGSKVEFKPLAEEGFLEKCELKTLEGRIYQNIAAILSDPANQEEIQKEFPDSSIKRRNTGYAIDLLLKMQPFSASGEKFNFSKLIAGSEGTIFFITEIKLHLDHLPPPVKGLVCVHCKTLEEALKGNLIALKYDPGAIELIDNIIMELSKKNLAISKNRFFIEGEPKAMLLIEFARNSEEEILEITGKMEKELVSSGYGYHFPVVFGSDIQKVWSVRKGALGLLSNIPGDAKPVPVVEDAALRPEDLPEYINDLQELFEKDNLKCVYHAHIATGELHPRPVLNLKKKEDVELFHTIASETAKLVKKYNGSLSGEHGDGRLRGEFIPYMIGERNYKLLKQIKRTWDPENIFNPGKIIEVPVMNTSLRYAPGKRTQEFKTFFDFSSDLGFLQSIEKCNGSGDCRKSEIFGGTMCPSYQATRDEKHTTRARANTLRELLTNPANENPFNQEEIYDILDLCLSCKGCKSECPSNVDMAKYKAEFLQHYYDANKIPLRIKLIANNHRLNKIGSFFPSLTNFILSNRLTKKLLSGIFGFAPKRSLPKLYKTTLKAWLKKQTQPVNEKKVYLFADEFTNFNEVEIGIKAVKILNKLGYAVEIPEHDISGRTFISKGLLRKAKEVAITNVEILRDVISKNHPLIGIEPSGILTFRDEYPDLVGDELKQDAVKLAKSTLMFEEFIAKEFESGNISIDNFIDGTKKIKLHGHCQQKSIASTEPTKKMLSLPINYSVEEIESGCCGMAGSFGYEKEHYDLSMKIGELVLFPAVRKSENSTLIAASGTSCRQQIMDGTGKRAFHPIEILYDALK